ncbi:ABC transporter ATP-binding protein [Streptomyces sulphureus]|uniref:ABC transporter ATP-binding protein n=1 Tax=Streptomyces sulphureus TaxID=47758 RepID=UPI000375D761|nr:ABC transporter ATP-binding protein [Streptomyces sulphureus]
MTQEPAPGGQPPLVDTGALKNLVRPVRGKLLLGVALAGLSSACALVPYVAVAELGRTLLEHGTSESTLVWWWVLAGIGGAVLRSLLYIGATQLCHYADADFRYLTRSRIARHLGRLPLGWFSANGSGEVKKAVADDVKQVHTLVAHAAADMTSGIVMPLAAVVYMLTVDWRVGLLVVGYVCVVLAVLAPRIQQGYQRNMDAFNTAQAELTKTTVELADGVEVIKTYGTASRSFGRFAEATDRLSDVCMRWMAGIGRPTNLINTLLSPASMVVWIAAVGCTFIAFDWTAPGTLLPFLAVGVGLPSTVLNVAQLGYAIRDAQLGATHIARVLSERPLPEPESAAVPKNSRVTFEGVTFGYGEGTPALRDIDVVLEPGTVTALVGPSGSGKTTFARLVPRFWDVDAGSIRIGGSDVRDIPTQKLLSMVAFVFQDVILLRTSVRDNIRLGRPEATDEEVESAARAAQIHDVITTLPDGYDTVLGEENGELSGGERQRVTIARAILQDAPVVILDEATAHADPHSEADVQRALGALSRNRTLLVIAHRLHTIAGVDQIVVLDEGKVAERGTHGDLLESGGLYSRLWKAQQTVQETGK